MNPTLLAAAIVRDSPALAAQLAGAVAAGADLVELRVDRLGDHACVADLLREPRRAPLILTVRPAFEGGGWDGPEDERVALVERLGLMLPGFIDFEWSAWERSANVRQKVLLVCGPSPRDAADRPRNRLILSHHDWHGTPDALDEILDRMESTPADVLKVACMTSDAVDALRLLDLLRRRARRRPLAALPMGEAAVAGRVLSRKFGGFLTFAALDEHSSAAPGQPTLRELIHVYRWRSIGAATRVFGVVGWPVAHSRGPHVHNAALCEQGLDAVYVPLPVGPTQQRLFEFLDAAAESGWLDLDGLSVTIPHKEHALCWVERSGGVVSPAARAIGATNTLTRRDDGRWAADNTDADGALLAMADVLGHTDDPPRPGRHDGAGPDATRDAAVLAARHLQGRPVALLGAGGAARAVALALRDAGARVTVFGRTQRRARELAGALGLECGHWEDRAAAVYDVIVNCTPVGMSARATRAAGDPSPWPIEALRPGMIVFDCVYDPIETPLVRAARQSGCRVVPGSAMFLAQAALQHRRWHARPAPRQAMARALLDSLGGPAPPCSPPSRSGTTPS